MDNTNLYEVWVEGYAATGEHGTAQKLSNINREDGKWQAIDFKEAVVKALATLKWRMEFFDSDKLTFWGCRFYDNEQDARKSFG
jgi:hypothetical protein